MLCLRRFDTSIPKHRMFPGYPGNARSHSAPCPMRFPEWRRPTPVSGEQPPETLLSLPPSPLSHSESDPSPTIPLETGISHSGVLSGAWPMDQGTQVPEEMHVCDPNPQ